MDDTGISGGIPVQDDVQHKNDLQGGDESEVAAYMYMSTGDEAHPDPGTETAGEPEADRTLEIDVAVVWDGAEAKSEANSRDIRQHSTHDGDPELTDEHIQAMFCAVREGEIDELDDLLDMPGAHINIEWFSENLLMAALRSGQEEMAIFLIDNGVDYNYLGSAIDAVNKRSHAVDWYTVSCRQLAYDRGLYDVVELIDEKNQDLWRHAKRRPRTVRLKKPLEEKLRERAELLATENEEDIDGELLDNIIDCDDVVNSPNEQDKGDHIASDVDVTEDLERRSSGYSSLSSEDPQEHSFSCVNKKKLVGLQYRHGETKSTLCKRQISRHHIAQRGHQQVRYARCTSAFGSYRSESRLWAIPQRPRHSIQPSVHEGTRTLSPWRDDPPSRKIRARSAPAINHGRVNCETHFRTGSRLCQSRPTTSFLPVISQSTALPTGLGIPVSRPHTRPGGGELISPRPSTVAKDGIGTRTQRIVDLDAVGRNRGQNMKVSSKPSHFKYSPAGLVRTVSTKAS